eukprot:scaffold565_cov379-Pinguiococcus_pyrenoidosus.AAC.9
MSCFAIRPNDQRGKIARHIAIRPRKAHQRVASQGDLAPGGVALDDHIASQRVDEILSALGILQTSQNLRERTETCVIFPSDWRQSGQRAHSWSAPFQRSRSPPRDAGPCDPQRAPCCLESSHRAFRGRDAPDALRTPQPLQTTERSCNLNGFFAAVFRFTVSNPRITIS